MIGAREKERGREIVVLDAEGEGKGDVERWVRRGVEAVLEKLEEKMQEVEK